MATLVTPMVVLELPQATPSNNVIKGMHFHTYKKTREAWQLMVQGAVQVAAVEAVPTIENCFIEVERHCAGGGLDWDNAYGGLKPMLDCLVAPSAKNPSGLGLIRDDSPKYMPYPPLMTQHAAKKGAGKTIVRIFDASNLVLGPQVLQR